MVEEESFGDLTKIEEQCRVAAINVTRSTSQDGDRLILSIPTGNGHTRDVVITSADARHSLPDDFEHFKFLGRYEAIFDTRSGSIESAISPAFLKRIPGSAPALPGVEVVDEHGQYRPLRPAERELRKALYNHWGSRAFDSARADQITELMTHPDFWRLRVTKGEASIELSPPSLAFQDFSYFTHMGVLEFPSYRNTTLKILGASPKNHGAAIDALEQLGRAFLFELDLKYQCVIDLATFQPYTHVDLESESLAKPRFPQNVYSQEALSLYSYGRSAQDLPLAEFLAYYQVLEYFFPVFTRDESIRQLKQKIKDPRFDMSDDVHIGRIISLLQSDLRRSLNDASQLRTTVKRCATADDIRMFVESEKSVREHFCSKRQSIDGTSRLILESNDEDLLDQLADRFYAIRCMIVHTKQDHRDPRTDLFLPSAEEAQTLRYDIDLVRVLAQAALVTGATSK